VEFNHCGKLYCILVSILLGSCLANKNRIIPSEDVSLKLIQIDTLGLLTQTTDKNLSEIINSSHWFPLDSVYRVKHVIIFKYDNTIFLDTIIADELILTDSMYNKLDKPLSKLVSGDFNFMVDGDSLIMHSDLFFECSNYIFEESQVTYLRSFEDVIGEETVRYQLKYKCLLATSEKTSSEKQQ
tara:strand:+ start:18998 stop:19549 length:552 start_codon:yes stop_codon:yes gene_type:complete